MSILIQPTIQQVSVNQTTNAVTVKQTPNNVTVATVVGPQGPPFVPPVTLTTPSPGVAAPLRLNTPSTVGNPGLLIVESQTGATDLAIASAAPGQIRTTFSAGTLFTNDGIVISGLFAGTVAANGNISITSFGLDKLNGVPTMITTVSDVLGPNIANELSTAYNAGTGAYFELNVDNAGVYIHTVEADGSHYWGLGTTHASLDTGLRRLSAGNIQVQNGAANNATGTLTAGQILVSDFAGNNKGGILTDGSQRIVAGAGIHFDPVTPGTTVFLLYDAGTTTQFFFRDNTNGRMQQTWNIGTAGNATNVFLDNVTVTGASGQTSDVLTVASSTANIIEATGNNHLGFFAATPVAQPTSATNTHTVAAGATTNVFTNTTFDGSIGSTAYTIGDIVAALKNLGLIKS